MLKVTLKHFVHLNDYAPELTNVLVSEDSWEMLRNSGVEGPFSLPGNREKWIEKCNLQKAYSLVAKGITDIASKLGSDTIYSHGVGCGYLEYLIWKCNSKLRIRCYDYTKEAMAVLREYFLEAEDVSRFDMRSAEWPTSANSLTLLFRVSTEFDNKTWQELFRNMYCSNIENVCFVPAEILTIRIGVFEKLRYLRSKVRREQVQFAGYLRTEAVYLEFWSKYYHLQSVEMIEGYNCYILRKRDMLE